jgi:3-oxoadipate enol-lactonase
MSVLLNHVVTGSAPSPALLLIHPLGADLSFWDDYVAAIDGRFTTIACDLRSSGGSFRATRPPSLADHAEDLEALRSALGVAQVVPVGCAIGSMTAAYYAATHPRATSALILTNPTPRTLPQARTMLTERAALVEREGIQAILPGAVSRAFVSQPQDERYQRYYDAFAGQDAANYALSTMGAAEADATEALKSLQCPTLLVPGRHDVLLPLANAELVHELVSGSHLVIAEEAAHFVPYQQPKFLADLTCRFLDRETSINANPE